MVNEHSLAAVEAAQWTPELIRPLYDSYCFANIPATIRSLLTGSAEPGLPADVLGDLPTRYQRVILLFIDSFGWRFWERYADRYPFLRSFVDDGVVSKLTSQFPSTTAAHVTAIHTGLPVGQSGVYEWHYYEPSLDRVITPLLFSYAGDSGRNTLEKDGVRPETLFPRSHFYRELQEQGVTSYVIQSASFTPSPYTSVVTDGAELIPFEKWSGALESLSMLLEHDERAYYYLYFGDIDAIAHLYGPSSARFDAEVNAFLAQTERFWETEIVPKLKDTLLLVTADHGHMETDPQTAFYVNQRLPGFTRYLKQTHDGRPIVPAGSPRDMFMHVRDEHLDEAEAVLNKALEGIAVIYRTEDLIAQGFFGATVSDTFRSRVGNLVILPRAREAVWWFEEGRFDQHLYGHHGGLSREEMETILLCRAW